MIELARFRKAYPPKLILDIPTFTITAGTHWVRGDNGAGKSTLFKSIAGLIPFNGDILIDGISQQKTPVQYRKLVAYSEAEPIYPGFLSAKDLVRFVGEARGIHREEQDLCCDALAISDYFESPCETYSSGMLKRTSLALAFLGSPSVIILDEPLVSLDSNSRLALNQLIKLKKEAIPMLTLLLSSHESMDHGFAHVDSLFEVSNQSLKQE